MSTNQKGCCYWLCKCFYRETKSQTSNIPNANMPVLNQTVRADSRNVPISGDTQNIIQIQSLANNEKKIQNLYKKFKINSTYTRKDVECRDELFFEQNIKYHCPICFKHYDKILKLSCCHNYICIFCAEDFLTTHIKYDFNLKCPFCGVDGKTIILDDVQVDDLMKNYSETSSPKKITNPCPNISIGNDKDVVKIEAVDTAYREEL
jgi:hypothetical protein